MSDQEVSDAWAIADGDLDFTPPLRFEFKQGSDETGEHYTRVAKFVDAKGVTIMDLTHDGDWVDTQMHAIAAVLSIARRRLLAAKEKP